MVLSNSEDGLEVHEDKGGSGLHVIAIRKSDSPAMDDGEIYKSSPLDLERDELRLAIGRETRGLPLISALQLAMMERPSVKV